MTKFLESQSLLELIPNPTTKDVVKIATKVGCSERTVWRALKGLGLTDNCQSDTRKKKIKYNDKPAQGEKSISPQSSFKPTSGMVGLIENNLSRILKAGTNDGRILNTAISFSDKTNQFVPKESEEYESFVDYQTVTEKFTDKQLTIFNAMIREGFVSLLGSRKTGKTFLISTAAIYLGSRKKLEIHVLSSKKDTASHILTQVIIIDLEHKLNLFKRPAKEQIIFNNYTRIKAHSNTVADTGTYEADILVIDEAQEVDEIVWAKIIPQLATGRKMRVWIFGTAKAGTPFHRFWFGVSPRFKKFELGMEDATWVKEEDWDSIKSLMSDRMVRQELRMEWVEPEGAFFRTKDVEAAFEPYPEGFKRDYLEFVCGVDFGQGHETVMGNLAYRKEQIYEIESWGKFNPTSDMILAKVREYNNRYASLFIMEGSPLGGFVRRDVKDLGVKFKTSNFSLHKDQYWFALNFLLNNHLIHLKSPKLKQQLLRYIGDKIDDDWVDMLLHAAYYYFNKYYKNNEVWMFNK